MTPAGPRTWHRTLPTIVAGTRMEETALALQLIGDIYDAALDRSLWPSVLESACRYVGGACTMLVAQDPFANAAEFQVTRGLDADAMWALLEKSVIAASALTVLHEDEQARADEGAPRRLRLLAPHFRRAVAIGKVIDLHKGEAAALADTLDGLATATILVDRTARIVHANQRGRELLSDAAVLRASGGELEVVERKADRALKNALAAAAGDAHIGEKEISVPLAIGTASDWLAHILPLTPGTRRRAGTSRVAIAAVFVCKAELDLRAPVETLAKAHRLTPAEVRVLIAFMETGVVPEVAALLGISEPTARTHMQRIFGKVGVKRQVDLVKLVASYITPLATQRERVSRCAAREP
jgi:DNA-binding CsgD family transcriptional regulator